MKETVLHVTTTALEDPASDLPSPPQQYNVQRRGSRVRVPRKTTARLQIWDVTLVNLSISGALVEHTHRVRVGEPSLLAMDVDGVETRVKVRVVRSFVSHFVPITRDEQQLFYRTGIEFVDISDEAAKRISAYLERLRATKSAG